MSIDINKFERIDLTDKQINDFETGVSQPRDVCVEMLLRDPMDIDCIKDITEELALISIMRMPLTLKAIPKEVCTEKVYLVAVSKEPITIQWIENPSLEVCKKAFEIRPDVIKYIKNKTEEQILLALKEDISVMQFISIEQQTYSLCKHALDIDFNVLRYISNPSEKVCVYALRKSAEAIKYIKNPTYKMCVQALSINPHTIKYIKKPSGDLCMLAVNSDGLTVEYIDNPAEIVCLAAIEQNPDALGKINKQTKEMCLKAITKKPTTLAFVINQTPELCWEAVKREPKLIRYVKSDENFEYCREKMGNIQIQNRLQKAIDVWRPQCKNIKMLYDVLLHRNDDFVDLTYDELTAYIRLKDKGYV